MSELDDQLLAEAKWRGDVLRQWIYDLLQTCGDYAVGWFHNDTHMARKSILPGDLTVWPKPKTTVNILNAWPYNSGGVFPRDAVQFVFKNMTETRQFLETGQYELWRTRWQLHEDAG